MNENKIKKIEIYSTPTCHFCNMAKDWFKEKGLAYTEYDVAKDIQKRKEMVELTGQLGVPVIKIGEEVLVGFNPNKISEALSSKG
ncbi:MAG: glutaredoxin family protein [Candidatus Pacebacteria bacterium]|nr:glutaredoxin family protein [Candidatus Paceibacterota bacterium]